MLRVTQANQGTISGVDNSPTKNTISSVGTYNNGTVTGVSSAPTYNQPLTVTTNTGMQGGANPQPVGSGSTVQYGAPIPGEPSSPTYGAVNDPTQPTAYDAAAAKAAADLARANELKGSISSVIQRMREVYDSIYGDIGAVGVDKARAVQERFGKETGALTDQFNSEFPRIGNAYSARNAYDSSYRYDAEQGAVKQYGNMVDNLATGRDEDLAKVGEFVETGRATVNADKAKLDTIIDRISKSTDPNELEGLKAQYENTLQDLISSRSGYQSQQAFRGQANALVNTSDRTGQLTQSLSNIIAGAAPSVLKRQVGQQLITQSGLSPEEQQRLLADFNSQLGGTTQSEQTQPITGTATA